MILGVSAIFILFINFEKRKLLSNLTYNRVEALASGDGDPNLYFIAEGNSIMYPRYGPI